MSATVIAQLYGFAETPGMPPCEFDAAAGDADHGIVPDLTPSGLTSNGLTKIDPAQIDVPEAEAFGEDLAQESPTPVADEMGILDDTHHPDSDPDLWLYRKRTVALLRRYMRLSIEVGRLPSLLGREFFRTRVTSYRAASFEDAVIFVHDVERSLEELSDFDKKLIAKIVLQEYSHEEAARLLGCGQRHTARCYVEALDRVSEILLTRRLLLRLPCIKPEAEKSCQGGKRGEFPLSDSEQAENNY
jgi:DNA-directed RNA polymerase specialized sigma24 family protein